MTTATVVNIKENQELWATHQIDTLGDLLARIDELQAQADLIKDQLKNLGEGVRVGDHYTSEVKLYQRTTVDHKGVYAELSVPAELIAKHSKSTAVISINVKAIKGE
jgi:hypothetical protein